MKEKTSTTQIVTYTEPKPQKGQDNRSGDNFSTNDLRGNYLKWHCPSGVCFRIMEDKTGRDSEIFAIITDQCITPMRRSSKYYIANPQNTGAYTGKIGVTIEGIEEVNPADFFVACNTGPLNGQNERSSDNFVFAGALPVHTTVRCASSIRFDIKQDIPSGYDPQKYASVTCGDTIDFIPGEKYYLANPHGVSLPVSVLFEIKKDGLPIDPTRWMAGISSEKRLTELTIPGTHDAGTANFGPGGSHCQNFHIDRQLADGIRFLDIRLGQRAGVNPGDELELYHGGFRCDLTFKTVMNWCADFLAAHPSETILMSIKHESGSKDMSNDFAEYLRDYPNLYYKSNIMPQLGQVRGKIVFFYRFDFKPDTAKFPTVNPLYAGICFPEWPDDTTFDKTNAQQQRFRIEDEYSMHDTNQKAKHVKLLLDEAALYPKDIYTCYITFNSIALGGSTPYQYAWGGNGVNPAMNPWLHAYLRDNNGWRYGIILLDFYNNEGMDENPVKLIISANF